MKKIKKNKILVKRFMLVSFLIGIILLIVSCSDLGLGKAEILSLEIKDRNSHYEPNFKTLEVNQDVITKIKNYGGDATFLVQLYRIHQDKTESYITSQEVFIKNNEVREIIFLEQQTTYPLFTTEDFYKEQGFSIKIKLI